MQRVSLGLVTAEDMLQLKAKLAAAEVRIKGGEVPGIDRECEGEGATHHHACKCREEYFERLGKAAFNAAQWLEYICNQRSLIKNDPRSVKLGAHAVELELRAALGKK